jgi:hypothetical protein
MLKLPEAVHVLLVKLRFLKVQKLENVRVEEPPVMVKSVATEAPPLKDTVAVATIFRVKPPVPVRVKLVVLVILSIVVAATVLVRLMLPEPKDSVRTLLVGALKEPVDKL